MCSLNIYRVFKDSNSVSFKLMTDKIILSKYKEDPFVKRIDRVIENIGDTYTIQLKVIEDYEYEFEKLVDSFSKYVEITPIDLNDRGSFYEISGKTNQTLGAIIPELGYSCWPIINNTAITDDEYDLDYLVNTIWEATY